MPVTAALVNAQHNRLRYLITSDASGGTLAITTTGAASPDLRTDSLQGPIKQIAFAAANGIGNVVAGALTQAQARAILLSNDPGSVVGNANMPRAISQLTQVSGAGIFSVDANVTGGNPVLNVTCTAAVGVSYLDIECPGIGA